MRFRIDAKTLREAVHDASQACAPNRFMPVLRALRIECTRSPMQFSVTATDLDTHLSITREYDTLQPIEAGSIVIDAKLIARALKGIGGW